MKTSGPFFYIGAALCVSALLVPVDPGGIHGTLLVNGWKYIVQPIDVRMYDIPFSVALFFCCMYSIVLAAPVLVLSKILTVRTTHRITCAPNLILSLIQIIALFSFGASMIREHSNRPWIPAVLISASLAAAYFYLLLLLSMRRSEKTPDIHRLLSEAIPILALNVGWISRTVDVSYEMLRYGLLALAFGLGVLGSLALGVSFCVRLYSHYRAAKDTQPSRS